jgi:hypothetical protein
LHAAQRVRLRLVFEDEESELECFGEPDLLETGSGRTSNREVPAVERVAETAVVRAVGTHERMFA